MSEKPRSLRGAMAAMGLGATVCAVACAAPAILGAVGLGALAVGSLAQTGELLGLVLMLGGSAALVGGFIRHRRRAGRAGASTPGVAS